MMGVDKNKTARQVFFLNVLFEKVYDGLLF